ncbi:hypothetical protein INT48_007797 [Thamnidium elegans]|uniref:Uncharacterized protein n=1 Tax=Thamnidium elegans TaxID=101142 RepID=A0A8H7SGH2_9FUNG|nr:hypothetical protein INT48_007797 [Thamnidium elegans]
MRSKRRSVVDIKKVEEKKKRTNLTSSTAEVTNNLRTIINSGPYSDILHSGNYVELDDDMSYNIIKREDSSRKLIVASKSMNALITSSLRIDQEILPEIGNSTLQFIPSKKTKIFILQSQLDAAKKAYASEQ